MAEVLFGEWTVEVIESVTGNHRFTIVGSDASDGVYDAVPGASVGPVSGEGWSIRTEWNADPAQFAWEPSTTRRNTAGYTLQDGLVVELVGYMWTEPAFAFVHTYTVLRCRNVDPAIHRLHPFVNPYDFTVPDAPRPGDPPGGVP